MTLENVMGKYESLNFNIVLIEPQIPNNTGNIGRTCVATCSRLHLIRPLGFEITDKRVKRAGLDYWPDLEIYFYDNIEQWYQHVEDPSRVFFFTAHAPTSFYNVELKKGDWLVFGKEAEGFDQNIHQQFKEQLVKIPFPGKVRSFNLSNAVAMALGEGLRQLGNEQL
ncbi:MAG: tRNA (cytidine(34)-2'-O)-methyltransferase [Chitinophagales bacterium]